MKFTAPAATLAIFASALRQQCHAEGVLDPQGPISSAERLILLNATTIMLVVVIPVIVLTLAFAWWYRASNERATYWPEWSYSGRIEFVVWSIPLMVVLLLSAVAWIGSHDLDPSRPMASPVQPVHIDVVSLDWKWLFIYPDEQVATVNQLIVPIGTPVEFTLTSATVMNAFFIPQLGTQIYTMPGMATHLNLLATRAGDYSGISSHFSGDGFSDMRFAVHAITDTQYRNWIGRARLEQPPLDNTAYTQLARATSNLPPQTYGRVAPMLFERILKESASKPIALRLEN
jgi:cytochrome o ubiquinol oxidase subunit II